MNSIIDRAVDMFIVGLEDLYTGSGEPIYSEPVMAQKREQLLTAFDATVGASIESLSGDIKDVEAQITELEDKENNPLELSMDTDTLSRAGVLVPLLGADAERASNGDLVLLAERVTRSQDNGAWLVIYRALEKRLSDTEGQGGSELLAQERAELRDCAARLRSKLTGLDPEALKVQKNTLAQELRTLRDRCMYAHRAYSQVHNSSEVEKARTQEMYAYYRL